MQTFHQADIQGGPKK